MANDPINEGLANAKSTVDLIGAVMKVAGDQPDVKASGENLAKAAKTVTTFINVALLPLAAVNYGYKKAAEYFEQRFPLDMQTAAAHIPPENLKEPAPSLVGQALQGLSFTHDNSDLRGMYLRLIATAMDNRVAESAHPAFAEVIKQLSPNEASLLLSTLKLRNVPIVEIRIEEHESDRGKFNFPKSYRTMRSHVISVSNAGVPVISDQTAVYVDNWIRLGLIEVSYSLAFADEGMYKWTFHRPEYLFWTPQDHPPSHKVQIANGQLIVTAFGRDFGLAVGSKA